MTNKTNQELINELTAELEASKANRKAIEEANTVKWDGPELKRTWKHHGNRFVSRVVIK